MIPLTYPAGKFADMFRLLLIIVDGRNNPHTLPLHMIEIVKDQAHLRYGLVYMMVIAAIDTVGEMLQVTTVVIMVIVVNGIDSDTFFLLIV